MSCLLLSTLTIRPKIQNCPRTPYDPVALSGLLCPVLLYLFFVYFFLFFFFLFFVLLVFLFLFLFFTVGRGLLS